VFFCEGARRDPAEVSAFVDSQRERFAVELICRTLGVSTSAYYQRATGERSARAVADEHLLERIQALHAENTTPTARGGCGRRFAARARTSAAIASRA